MKKFVLFFISVLAVDIIISNLIFKNTKYWENRTWWYEFIQRPWQHGR